MRLLILFIYTLFLALSIPIMLPQQHILFFAPFLIICYYRHKKMSCLWLALICGFLIDLFSSQTRLGFYALTYFLTVELTYSQQRHFFEDRLSTLPLMTFIFAVLSTIIQVPLLSLFDLPINLSMEWVVNALLIHPFYDALYAFIVFTLPAILFFKTDHRPSSMLRLKGRI